MIREYSVLGPSYAREVDRRTVKGIHGILHTHPKAKISIIEQTAG